jgi:hypothetical protein
MNILDYPDNIPNEVRDILNFDPNFEVEFWNALDALQDLGYEVERGMGQMEIEKLVPKNKLFYLKDASRLDAYDGVTDIKVGEYFWWVEDVDEDTSIYIRASTQEMGELDNDRFIAVPRKTLECKAV